MKRGPSLYMEQRRFLLKIILTATILSPGCAGVSYADVFRAVDRLGIVHLTNVPADQGYQILLRSPRCLSSDSKSKTSSASLRKNAFNKIVARAAREQNLDQALLQAVIAVESGYDPQAVSSEGAVGLMQLMPATARRYGASNRYDPEENIQAGARYLRDLIDHFHDDLSLALAAYNAGEDAVVHYGNTIPPYPETREYVPRVMKLYQRYRANSP